jgi:hypothetical protein
MKLARGNMFLQQADLILVTTNSYVRSNGTLVMGRGAAAQVRQHLPGAEAIFGHRVRAITQGHVFSKYGVLIGPCPVCHVDHNPQVHMAGPQIQWGIFQVKYHWGRPAIPELISYSCTKLQEISHLYPSISLNFPGIGNGGLGRDEVLPLIEGLPGNVTVWEL